MGSLDTTGNTDKDTDKELVLKHVIEPKFSEETINLTGFGLVECLALTVLRASGMQVGKNVTVKKASEKIDSDFPENSRISDK